MSLVTQAEFSRICGVNRSTVHRWISSGRIEVDAQGLIDPVSAERMRRATESPMPHHQARLAQFEEGRGGVDTTQGEKTPQRESWQELGGKTEGATGRATGGNTEPGAERLGIALKLETYKLQKAKAEMANLELDQKAGTLVERAEMDFVLAEFGSAVRGLIESMPDRLSPSIARHRGDVNAVHAELESYVADLLTEISDQMKRKQEAITV